MENFDADGGAPLISPLDFESPIMVEHKQPEGEHHQPAMVVRANASVDGGGVGEAINVVAAVPEGAPVPAPVVAPVNAPMMVGAHCDENVMPQHQAQFQPDQVGQKELVPILRELGQALLVRLFSYSKWWINQIYSTFRFVKSHQMLLVTLITVLLVSVLLSMAWMNQFSIQEARTKSIMTRMTATELQNSNLIDQVHTKTEELRELRNSFNKWVKIVTELIRRFKQTEKRADLILHSANVEYYSLLNNRHTTYHTVLATEHKEVRLICPSGYEIFVRDVLYGELDKNITRLSWDITTTAQQFPQWEAPFQTVVPGKCASLEKIKKHVWELCNRDSICTVSTTDHHHLPTLDDSCEGKKSLFILYECAQTTASLHDLGWLHRLEIDWDVTKSQLEIKPRQFILDHGQVDKLRGWFDVQGQGVKNDYCRWTVPSLGGFKAPLVWFSCALAGSTNQHTEPNVYMVKDGKVVRGPKWTEKLGLA